MSEAKESKVVRKSVLVTLFIICIILAFGLVTVIAVYTSTNSSLTSQITTLQEQITTLQKELTTLQKQFDDLQNATEFNRFFLEFGNVPLVSQNLNFSPPIRMYRALTIGLESDGWNASSLSDMQVFVYFSKYSSSSSAGTFIEEVTKAPEDYNPTQVNGTTYRYIWDITVQPRAYILEIPPPGLSWVDAATGEIVPHPLLL